MPGFAVYPIAVDAERTDVNRTATRLTLIDSLGFELQLALVRVVLEEGTKLFQLVDVYVLPNCHRASSRLDESKYLRAM